MASRRRRIAVGGVVVALLLAAAPGLWAGPLEPGQNVMGGARYLMQLFARFDRDLELTLAAYNAGPGRVEGAGRRVTPFPETKKYIEKVMRLYDGLRQQEGSNEPVGSKRSAIAGLREGG